MKGDVIVSVGSRIKDLREKRDLSRGDFAKLLGVTVGAVSNYENNVSSPKEPILFKVMEVLGCDANYIFQDAMKQSIYKDKATPEEFENIIKKYRDLDGHGKEMVDFVLEKEYERSASSSGPDSKARYQEMVDSVLSVRKVD